MVHGTPTWSFMYRHLVKALGARHRCVAPDHLGFGLSERPRKWSYRPVDQARNLTRLVEALGLKDLTLVVHDYGGAYVGGFSPLLPQKLPPLGAFHPWLRAPPRARPLQMFRPT